jgi:hypothetical protein
LGTQIVSLRIQQMLTVMLPNLVPVQAPVSAPNAAPVQTPPAPVQTPAKPQRTRVQAPVQDEDPAPVVVNGPPAVDGSLVAAVVNAPAVEQVQNVVPETPMEVEDEDALLQRLFFKKYGRALPDEREKEKESKVDQIKFVIDLTDDTDEMESDPTPVLIPIVKKEPIESAEPIEVVANVNNFAKANSVYNESGIRVSRRLARKAITEFGKSLRKTTVIPEKETENVIADNDTDMAEDVSVNPVGSVSVVESGNTIESLTAAEAFEMAEAAIAESDAAIAANQKVIDKFYDV